MKSIPNGMFTLLRTMNKIDIKDNEHLAKKRE